MSGSMSGDDHDPRPGERPDPVTVLPADTTISLGALHAPDTGEYSEPGLSAADEAAIGALPAGSALLVVRRGPNAGARFLLDAERTTAGRRPDSDIFLDDVTVSRTHAEFVRREGQIVVRAVGSLNGPPRVTGAAPPSSSRKSEPRTSALDAPSLPASSQYNNAPFQSAVARASGSTKAEFKMERPAALAWNALSGVTRGAA